MQSFGRWLMGLLVISNDWHWAFSFHRSLPVLSNQTTAPLGLRLLHIGRQSSPRAKLMGTLYRGMMLLVCLLRYPWPCTDLFPAKFIGSGPIKLLGPGWFSLQSNKEYLVNLKEVDVGKLTGLQAQLAVKDSVVHDCMDIFTAHAECKFAINSFEINRFTITNAAKNSSLCTRTYLPSRTGVEELFPAFFRYAAQISCATSSCLMLRSG